MAGRNPGLSPASIARANRQRLATEHGKAAMAEVERKAVAVRDNMARLRALREAEESRKRETAGPAVAPAKKTRKPRHTS
nr:hypothetical protein [Bradyrhizobium lablabi]